MRLRTILPIFLASAATVVSASVAGCSDPIAIDGSGGSDEKFALKRMKTCEDLLGSIRADQRAKVLRTFDDAFDAVERGTLANFGFLYRSGADAEEDSSKAGFPSSAASPGTADPSTPTPQTGNASPGTTTTPTSPSTPVGTTSPAKDFSKTNTQVEGVDEADLVKTDGKYVYLVHGSKLIVLDAWPAANLAVVGEAEIEGVPSEMFLVGTKVVVHSTVVGEPVYTAAGATPKRKSTGTYTGGAVESSIAPVSDPNFAWSSNPLAKVTVLTLEGTQPKTTREIYYEGTYLSSRRIGSNVRTIVRGTVHEPEVDTKDVSFGAITFGPDGLLVAESRKSIAAGLAKLQAKVVAAIEASTLEDWLPRTFERKSGGIQTSAMRCGDFYVPGVGTTEFGVTSIESMDVDQTTTPIRGAAIVGTADLVYASPDRMAVAARAWAPWNARGALPVGSPGTSVGAATGSGTAVDTPPPSTTPSTPPSGGTPGGFVGVQDLTDPGLPDTSYAVNSTYLHTFDIATDVTTPLYVASGQVGGTVNNQFAIDEKGGLLRVATSTQLSPSKEYPAGRRENNVFVLDTVGTSLVSRGSVTGFGVDETIQSTRFLGNRAYVVTFRQTDPLFVIDLSTPSKPTILGELQIPGFSEYMHPLGDTHLLTIGRDGDANGRVNNLALQIFDVSDGAHPRQAFKFVFANPGSSDAEYDHKAFTFFAERNLLAFPFTGTVDGRFQSVLEVFKVGIDTGFDRMGAIDVSALVPPAETNTCTAVYGPSVRRGLFLEDVAYAVASGGIVAAKVDALGSPVGSVALPVPAYAMPLSVAAPSVGCTKPVPSEPVDGGSPIDAGPAMDGGAPTPVPDAAPPTPSSDGGTDAKGD